MTPQEFARDLQNKVDEIKRTNRPLQIAAASAHARMSKRIFSDGRDSSEGNIGQYSTEGIYINPNKTATRNKKGFTPPTGKTGRSVFASTGQPHKTSYFEGWKGFRETQGLKTNVVNLKNTDDLFFDFNRPPQQVDVNTWEARLTRDINNKKARGNEAHFGKTIFSPSQAERKAFARIIEQELKLLFSK